jgi:hypothetical protein
MHPIQDLFLESFSCGLQIDMHFICTPMWTKNFILVKSGCYRLVPRGGVSKIGCPTLLESESQM